MLALLEELARSLLDFLEEHPNISQLHFPIKSPASDVEIRMWEASHAPVKLPEDIKSFYLQLNGLAPCWDIWLTTSPVALGCMHATSLSELKPVPESVFCSGPGTIDESLPPELAVAGLRAYDLDSTCTSGRVCIFLGNAEPQVWFQDNSCMWYFIASSFTDYFRLMVLNLGLPRWQYAYTEAGLDPVAKQWFKLLAPARLDIIDARAPSIITGSACSRPIHL
ncbi:MAG: hypothetical protein SGPRY_009410 [Prymnesium sp.]